MGMYLYGCVSLNPLSCVNSCRILER